MVFENISNTAMAGMIISLVISFVVPIGALLYMIIKRNAKVSVFFIGCGVFFVFAFILESLFHLAAASATGGAVFSNIFITAIYSGLAAAAFEETGRLIAMKFLMKNKLTSDNAIMYGAGHGGFQAMINVGLVEITNITIAKVINDGQVEKILAPLQGDNRESAIAMISQLCSTPTDVFYLDGIRIILSIATHIALSYFVFMAVKYGEKKCLMLAYGLHFLLDASTVIVNSLVNNAYMVELYVLAVTAGIIYNAIHFKNQLNVDTEEEC